jgi:Putative peptidoglycan binding domain/D-alanyl-D-alanine carboxypeptidase
MATELTTFTGSQFVGRPVLVDVEFVAHLQRVNQFAAAQGLQVHVTSATRQQGVAVGGTIVPPASRSNHLVGHAIDMNPKKDGQFFDSGALGKTNFRQLPGAVKKFIKAIQDDRVMRWGGDFASEDPVHIDDGLNVKNPALWDEKFPIIQRDLIGLTRPQSGPTGPRLLFLERPFMTGSDVRAVQEKLIALGFEMNSDSGFGPLTDRAVTEFQRQKGLEPDGIVGPDTLEALGL